jgi:hypothetical protein
LAAGFVYSNGKLGTLTIWNAIVVPTEERTPLRHKRHIYRLYFNGSEINEVLKR